MSEPMILRVRLSVPLKEVHHALTDPGELRVWLAEHAEVDLPDRYEFWGRYTPEGDAPHQRLLHADDHTLRFSWLLGGEETTTEFRLEEESGDSTILTLSQSHFDFQEAISGTGVRGVLQTFWGLSIANLADHLHGRPIGPKVDFTATVLRGEVDIAAPAEVIFDSLTDSDKATEWFGHPIGIEPYVGGRFAMGGLDDNPHPAKIIELTPGRSLSVDWGPVGVVSWELEESGGKTRLTFVQSGFDTANPPYAAWGGWLSGIFELRRYHELSDWRPIWLQVA
ncbi:SRPBCC family protein [Microbispora sp. NPDC049125]|uniref:SRPBCC family protein n=1 Tax=Microbispora sp. NPDC049125 TaxID=3154929 RepID=UPI003465807E